MSDEIVKEALQYLQRQITEMQQRISKLEKDQGDQGDLPSELTWETVETFIGPTKVWLPASGAGMGPLNLKEGDSIIIRQRPWSEHYVKRQWVTLPDEVVWFEEVIEL